MSYTEYHYGKLRKISFPEEGDNAENVIKIGESFYVIEDTEFPEEINILKDLGNGEFEYAVSFYNGGTCLEEMLEELMLKKLKENNETV